MSLRNQLLLSYAYLVTLLLASAIGGALGFHRMGDLSSSVLDELTATSHASQRLLASLEKQESATLTLLLDPSRPREPLTRAEAEFVSSLDELDARSTDARTAGEVAAIRQSFEQLRKARIALLSRSSPESLPRLPDAASVEAASVEAAIESLIETQAEHRESAKRGLERAARRRAALQGLLVALAVLSLGFLSHRLGRDVFSRLAQLKAVAQAISEGDRRRRAEADRPDELGVIARQLNDMLDSQTELEGEYRGRLTLQRQSLLGLLNTHGPGATLLAPNGDTLASNLSSPPLFKEVIQGLEDREFERDEIDHPSLGTVELQRLRNRDRTVGWLAWSRPEEEASPNHGSVGDPGVN